MKILNKRTLVIWIALAVVLVSFISLIVVTAVSSGREKYYESYPVWIDGKYSVDGGEWKDTLEGEMLHEQFHTVTIRGTLSRPIFLEQSCLIVVSNNMWYRLETPGIDHTNFREDDFSLRRNTPGSNIDYFVGTFLFDNLGSNDEEVTLTLTYPYQMLSDVDLSDFINLYVSDATGLYQLMLEKKLPAILFCILVCFFGLIAFPLAGSLLGGINVRYLAFSLLCFFTGVYLLSRSMYTYLPMWIDDPILCMSICEFTRHLFGICVLIFIRVLCVEKKHIVIGNITLFAFLLMVILLFIFNLRGVIDFYAGTPYMQGLFLTCAAVLTVCLVRERKINPNARLAIFTLIPLGLTLLYDTLNSYLGFSDFNTFEFGVGLTLLYQIVNLLVDLRRQYKTVLHYQQMQRELYESRVKIMVSQIQPHFLYNSLSSIAMMCTIDPETAQEATVTFADYLRGNMDSLKQNKPVPFTQELEHLKKYLYIEKLRFGKKLNIEYDIQAEDFVIPQLSIQPLAENAVKHGISKKRGGGTLTIATRETEDSYQVIVSDNGKGFDVNEVKDDGRSHVGMENVKRRLHDMVGGKVNIVSVIGEGTVATVTLPKEEQNRENLMR